MEVEPIIEDMLSIYRTDLERFRPTDLKNGISEANLSFQFLRAFLARHPSGSAFLEVPFRLPGPNQRRDKHIDAFVFCDTMGVLVESKRAYGFSGASAVVLDCDRLTNTDIVNDALKGFRNGSKPEKLFGLVLAEIYQPVLSFWFNGDKSMLVNAQDFLQLLEKSSFSSFKHASFYNSNNCLWKNGEQLVGLGYAYRELK